MDETAAGTGGPADTARVYEALKAELGKVIMGQEEVIDQVLIALFAGGHVLIEGIPGLGKTLLASSLSRIAGGEFRRIQFTPDLMPSDIVGTAVFNAETREFSVKKGPVFCNLLLADEINRAPAKTQSALLQAMQEREVTIDGTDYPLEEPFLCFATQNPIDMEGTYPLPEAQIDRFFMKILIGYPTGEEEKDILRRYREGFDAANLETAALEPILLPGELSRIRRSLAQIRVDDKILDYITALIRATRSFPGVQVGASPRGGVDLFKASRVIAAVAGRDFVIPDDVKEAALPILRHRIILEVEAEIEGIAPEEYLKRILDQVDVPR